MLPLHFYVPYELYQIIYNQNYIFHELKSPIVLELQALL